MCLVSVQCNTWVSMKMRWISCTEKTIWVDSLPSIVIIFIEMGTQETSEDEGTMRGKY